MKKTYLTPQVTAYNVQASRILAGSDQIKVITDPNKKTETMLSIDCNGFEELEEEY